MISNLRREQPASVAEYAPKRTAHDKGVPAGTWPSQRSATYGLATLAFLVLSRLIAKISWR
jgi:hypothetical protein